MFVFSDVRKSLNQIRSFLHKNCKHVRVPSPKAETHNTKKSHSKPTIKPKIYITSDSHGGDLPVPNFVCPVIKKKVLLLSDSHGALLKDRLSALLGDGYDVDSVVCRGKTLSFVLSDVEQRTQNFTPHDCVIVLAGTNDVSKTRPYQLSLHRAFGKLRNVLRQTRVVFCSLPVRHDCPNLNADVGVANHLLFELLSRSQAPGAVWFNLKDLFRRNFTQHGLHLNKRGKDLLSKCLARLITSDIFKTKLSVSSVASLLSRIRSCKTHRPTKIGNSEVESHRSKDFAHSPFRMERQPLIQF